MPETTPSAASSASRRPDRMSILIPQMRSASRDEGRPVLGVAAGGGGNAEHAADLQGVAQRAKARQRRQGLGHRIGRQQPGRLHLAAETGQHLFVENRRRTAGQALIDHEAHRIRADIDHRDRRAVIEAALRGLLPAADRLSAILAALDVLAARFCRAQPCRRTFRRRASAYRRSWRRVSRRGVDSLSDFPRPDRLGLVMKYF